MTTATVTWPTKAELAEAAWLFAETFNGLDELSSRLKLLDEELDEPDTKAKPTLEELGTLSWFIAQAEQEIENFTSYLAEIRGVHASPAFSIRLREPEEVGGGA